MSEKLDIRTPIMLTLYVDGPLCMNEYWEISKIMQFRLFNQCYCHVNTVGILRIILFNNRSEFNQTHINIITNLDSKFRRSVKLV